MGRFLVRKVPLYEMVHIHYTNLKANTRRWGLDCLDLTGQGRLGFLASTPRIKYHPGLETAGDGTENGNVLNPPPYTLHPELCNLRPTSYTLHQTSHTLPLTPCTLHLTPYILHAQRVCVINLKNVSSFGKWHEGGTCSGDAAEEPPALAYPPDGGETLYWPHDVGP